MYRANPSPSPILSLVAKHIAPSLRFMVPEQLRILYVLEGSVLIQFASGSMILSAGDIEILNIGEPFRLSSSEENTVIFFDFDSGFIKSQPINIAEMRFNCNYTIIYPANVNTAQLDGLRLALDTLLDLYCGQGMYKTKHFDDLSHDLFLLLNRDFDNLTNIFIKEPNADLHSERFISINSYICNNFTKKITLSEIAEREHISLHHLSKAFSEKHNITFGDLLSFHRIRYSISLLITTQMTINDISEKCGFSATRYYYKWFKYYLDTTPHQFRKNLVGTTTGDEHLENISLVDAWVIYKKGVNSAFDMNNFYNTSCPYKILLVLPVNEQLLEHDVMAQMQAVFKGAALIHVKYAVMHHKTEIASILTAMLEYDTEFDGVFIADGNFNQIHLLRDAVTIPVITLTDALMIYHQLSGIRCNIIPVLTPSEGELDKNREKITDKIIFDDTLSKTKQLDYLIATLEAYLIEHPCSTIAFSTISLIPYYAAIKEHLNINIAQGITEASILLKLALSPAWNAHRET